MTLLNYHTTDFNASNDHVAIDLSLSSDSTKSTMTNEQRTAALAWLSLNAEPGKPLKDSEREKWEERLDRYIKSWQKEGAAPTGPLDLAGLAAIQAHVRIQYDQAKVRRHNAGKGAARQDALDIQERQNRKYGLILRALASSLPSPIKPDTPYSHDKDLKPATPHPSNPTLYPSLATDDEEARPPPYPQPTNPQSWQDKPSQHGPVGPAVPSDAFEPPLPPDSRQLMNSQHHRPPEGRTPAPSLLRTNAPHAPDGLHHIT